MERGGKNLTPIKTPGGSSIIQDEHDHVNFLVSKITNREENIENTMLRKVNIMV